MLTDQPLTASDVMTAGEVADLLRLPKRTVYELAKRDELPCSKYGRAIRFVRSDIEATLRTQVGGSNA